jgi:hypothetical protein
MIPVFLAAIVINDQVMGGLVQPGFEIIAGTVPLFDRRQQVAESFGSQVAGSFNIAHLPVDVTIDGQVIPVISGAQGRLLAGRL